MFFSKEKSKGQGALEYLLIIGGALVVAVTVIVLVVSMSGSNREAAADQGEVLTELIDNTIIPPIVNIIDCNTTSLSFTLNSSDTNFYRKINNGTPVNFQITPENQGQVNVVNGLTAVEGRHTLEVAVVRGSKQSPYSKPASTCRP